MYRTTQKGGPKVTKYHLSQPLTEKVLQEGAVLSTHPWIPRHEVIWRREGHASCRLLHDTSSYLILAVHFHALPNAGQGRMKVSWLRFYPDTTGSSVMKQIMDLTPTASRRKAELAFGSVGPEARMRGAPPPPATATHPLRKVGVRDLQA